MATSVAMATPAAMAVVVADAAATEFAYPELMDEPTIFIGCTLCRFLR
jgi:hypothetical protein